MAHRWINAEIAEYEELQEAVSERLGRREFKTMAAFDRADKFATRRPERRDTPPR